MSKLRFVTLTLQTVVVSGIFFLLAVVGSPSLLRLYLRTTIGTCQRNPIFCQIPGEKIINPAVDNSQLEGMAHFMFLEPRLEIYLPRNFIAIKQEVKKSFSRRLSHTSNSATAYLVYQKRNFFTGLYPDIVRRGIRNDYTFLARTMNATIPGIWTVTDAFFLVMKSIFTPDLGDQKNLKIIEFATPQQRGFISYNLSLHGNYFDCNLLNNRGEYLKLYLRDKGATLTLDRVWAILSTFEAKTTNPTAYNGLYEDCKLKCDK